jgi:hypothetical protein
LVGFVTLRAKRYDRSVTRNWTGYYEYSAQKGEKILIDAIDIPDDFTIEPMWWSSGLAPRRWSKCATAVTRKCCVDQREP